MRGKKMYVLMKHNVYIDLCLEYTYKLSPNIYE